jgi:hypothetical protein
LLPPRARLRHLGRPAHPLVDGQRVGLAAAAVHGEHELRLDLLIQQALGCHLLQFGHELAVLSCCQPGGGKGSHDLHAQQVQVLGLLVQPGQGGQVRERPPAPQGQRCLQIPHAFGWISELPAVLQEPLGALHAGAVAEIKEITGRLGADSGPAAQDATQVRNVVLQGSAGRRGCGLTPHGLNQPVEADGLAMMQRQSGQYGLAPQPVHRARLAIHDYINWPQKPYLHETRLQRRKARVTAEQMHAKGRSHVRNNAASREADLAGRWRAGRDGGLLVLNASQVCQYTL